MRSYFLPIVIAVFGVTTACTSVAPPQTPVSVSGVSADKAGQVVRFEPIAQLDQAVLQQEAAHLPGAIAVKNGVSLYRLVYRSRIRGQVIDASALVAVPDTDAAPEDLVLYLRGSDIPRNAAPTTPNAIWTDEAAVFGGNGFAVIVPDYIGFGASPSPQAFLLTDENVADFRAALTAARSALGFKKQMPLFITGFSQGGQLSAALHRDLESRALPGFDLRATVAVAGPHELLTSFERRMNEPLSRDPVAMSYVSWAAYTFAWREGRSLNEVFTPAFAPLVAGWFGGSLSAEEIVPQFPEHVTQMFQPAFLQAVRSDPDFWFNRMLRASETHNWTPRTPLKIVLGGADDHVDPVSTRIFYENAKARGGEVSILEFPDLNHQQTGAAAYAPTLTWFETLRAPR